MGGALAEGLLDYAKIPAEDLIISDASQQVLQRFQNRGVGLTHNNAEAAGAADLLFVVVKPWLVESVIKEIGHKIQSPNTILVVIAAGVASSDLLEWLDSKESCGAVFLAIPNTAIAVGQSMTFLTPIRATKEQEEALLSLFNKMGTAMFTDEGHLSAGTSIASCGIAYAMRYLRAVTEGSVEMGFRAHDALNIAGQTVKGAVALLEARGTHPEEEIDKVTTPGGVAIKGLNAMERAGFTNAVISGLKAGANR